VAARRAVAAVGALLLLLTAMPVLPSGTDAATPKHRRPTPHEETSPSPVPVGPAAPAVYRVRTDRKVIALTFDDGWDATRCLAIGSILDRYGIPATFFPNGVYVRRSPAIWRSIGARFPIGNHTSHHPDLRDLSNAEIARELERNRKLIEGITGRPMAPLLRPPYGAFNARVAKVAGGQGYRHIVLWDISDGDTGPRATARGSAIAALSGGPGSIVLLHCGPAITPKLLPAVIERYACDGFRFATVEELLSGSDGHAARVDCPPLPLPPKTRRRPADPDASPGASPGPSLDPGMGPLPSAMPGRPSPIPTGLASPAPTREPILLHDLPALLAAWTERLAADLERLVDALPVPDTTPVARPTAPPVAPPSATTAPSPD
jgi:peptidoglycan/xylan/chitin deacetylase (PgdA/CDA1 family)